MTSEDSPIVLDVFLLTLTIPNGHPEAQRTAIRKTLDQQTVSSSLQTLVAHWLQSFPTLTYVTVTVSR